MFSKVISQLKSGKSKSISYVIFDVANGSLPESQCDGNFDLTTCNNYKLATQFLTQTDICTCKSLSEALIFASISPQYDNRMFMELPWAIFCHTYCGLVNARISVQPKPGFGIGNRNQDHVLVSVSEPKLFCLNRNFLHCLFSNCSQPFYTFFWIFARSYRVTMILLCKLSGILIEDANW